MRFCLLPIILFKEAHFVLNGNETVGSEHKKGEVMPLFFAESFSTMVWVRWVRGQAVSVETIVQQRY